MLIIDYAIINCKQYIIIYLYLKVLYLKNIIIENVVEVINCIQHCGRKQVLDKKCTNVYNFNLSYNQF